MIDGAVPTELFLSNLVANTPSVTLRRLLRIGRGQQRGTGQGGQAGRKRRQKGRLEAYFRRRADGGGERGQAGD